MKHHPSTIERRKRTERAAARPPVNERGIALILALVLLMLLSMLGALALSLSSTELRISGNYRVSEVTFYAADAAATYAATSSTVRSAIIPGSINTYPNNPDPTAMQSVTIDGAADAVRVRVEWLFQAGPPAGSGYMANLDSAVMVDYVVANVVGYGPGSAANRPETAIETMIGWVK